MKTNISFNEEFYSIPFYVDNRVLIPRNDTEILVDQALKTIKTSDFKEIIDIWTWSWVILISIFKNNNTIEKYYWIDISKDALEVASINIEKHNLWWQIKLLNSDLLEVFLSKNEKIFSKKIILTANLPYIKNWDFINMDLEVIQNEPHIALFWWEKTWFELYERLFDQIILLKNIYNIEKIILFIEIWFDQYEYSKSYLEKIKLNFEYFKDFNSIYRVIKIEF